MLPLKKGGGGGFLIDFDLAVSMLRQKPSGALHRTGTPIFMAIRVLEAPANLVHTFRYDLESFMYMLIWMSTFYTVTGEKRKDFSTLDCIEVPKTENQTRVSGWAKGIAPPVRSPPPARSDLAASSTNSSQA